MDLRTVAAVALAGVSLTHLSNAAAQCEPAALVGAGNTILVEVPAGSGREVRATLSSTTACVISGVLMKGSQVLASAEMEFYRRDLVFNVPIDTFIPSNANRLMVGFECLGDGLAPKLTHVVSCPESAVRREVRQIRQTRVADGDASKAQIKEELSKTTSQLLSQRGSLLQVRAYLNGWQQGAARSTMANPMAYGDFMTSMEEVTKNLPPAKKSVFEHLGDVLSGAIVSGASSLTGGLFGMFASLTESVVADAFDWGKAVNDGSIIDRVDETPLMRGPVVVAKVRTMLRAFKADFESICRFGDVLEIAMAKVDDAIRRHDLLLTSIQRQIRSKTPLDSVDGTRTAMDQYFSGNVSSLSMSALQVLMLQSQVVADDYVDAVSKSKFFVSEVRKSLSKNPFDGVLRELQEAPTASGLDDADRGEVVSTLTRIRNRWQASADALARRLESSGVPSVIR